MSRSSARFANYRTLTRTDKNGKGSHTHGVYGGVKFGLEKFNFATGLAGRQGAAQGSAMRAQRLSKLGPLARRTALTSAIMPRGSLAFKPAGGNAKGTRGANAAGEVCNGPHPQYEHKTEAHG